MHAEICTCVHGRTKRRRDEWLTNWIGVDFLMRKHGPNLIDFRVQIMTPENFSCAFYFYKNDSIPDSGWGGGGGGFGCAGNNPARTKETNSKHKQDVASNKSIRSRGRIFKSKVYKILRVNESVA